MHFLALSRTWVWEVERDGVREVERLVQLEGSCNEMSCCSLLISDWSSATSELVGGGGGGAAGMAEEMDVTGVVTSMILSAMSASVCCDTLSPRVGQNHLNVTEEP